MLERRPAICHGSERGHVRPNAATPPVVQTSTVVTSIASKTSQCNLMNVCQVVCRFRPVAGSIPCCLRMLPDSLVGNLLANIGQRPLNPVVAPRRILTSDPQNEIDDLLPDTLPTDLLPLIAAAPLPGDQHPMPT